MEGKPVAESFTEMVEIAFPNDANPLGTIFGGRVLQLIDIAGSVAAMRHARRPVVTARIDSVDFRAPIRVGEFIVLQAWVNFTGRTSMEIQVEVYAEAPTTGERRHCCTALLTYVALDEAGRPMPVPPVLPQTEAERQRYEAARARRAARLQRKEFEV